MRSSEIPRSVSPDAPHATAWAKAAPLIGIFGAWLVATVLIHAVGNYPSNDDWVYGAAVEALLRDGTFSLPSPASANVALQAYWGALFCLPFGFSYDALRASTWVLGIGGLFALYGAAREAGGTRRVALIATLALGLNPLWLLLENTFMTDVPFTALTTGAVWQITRWVRTNDTRSLVAAFAIALATILLRQFALVFVVGIGVATVVRSRFSVVSLVVLLGTAAFGLATHLGFQHWLVASGRTVAVVGTSLHEVVPRPDVKTAGRVLANIVVIMPYLGLMMAPVYLALGGGRTWEELRARRPLVLLGFAAAIIVQMAVVAKLHLHLPYLGNEVYRWGIGPLTLRDTYLLGVNAPPTPVAAAPIWTALMVVGIASAGMMVTDCLVDVVRVLSSLRQGTVAEADVNVAGMLVVILLYALIIALMAIALGWFDRYLLVLVAPLTVVIVAGQPSREKSPPRAGTGLAVLLIVGSALFGIASAHDYFAWQHARLAATDALRSNGVPATAIDGGYEFNGRYLYRSTYRRTPDKSYWWVADDQYVIASGPLPGYVVVARIGFTSWLTQSSRQVLTLRRTS